MHDLIPRMYADYTPIFPLLFAGYAFVFPRNAYAGTVFNLLLGLCAAAVALSLVLRQPAGRLRNSVAWIVAVMAPTFIISYDRPETAALILFSAAIAFGSKAGPRPLIAGTLISLTFLAHPFAAVAAAVWTFALFLSHDWKRPERGYLIFKQLMLMAVPVFLILGAVALLYYSIDHESVGRFAHNAMGAQSGVGVTLGAGSLRRFLEVLLGVSLFDSPLVTVQYLLALLSCGLLATWSLIYRKQLQPAEWLPIAAVLTSTLLAVILVPYQFAYIAFIAFVIPVGLLIWSPPGGRLAKPALAIMLFAVLFNLPNLGIGLIMRIEQKSSFRAAQQQPGFLRTKLASPSAVVVLEGDSYDLFKPEVHRMVALGYVDEDVNHFAEVGAVVNCYDRYHGEFGPVIPFPTEMNASEFHLIQPAPEHLWITLFGRKVMRAQWGYGCDLYLRNSPTPGSS
jgi:hypothetical protein